MTNTKLKIKLKEQKVLFKKYLKLIKMELEIIILQKKYHNLKKLLILKYHLKLIYKKVFYLFKKAIVF